MTTAIGYFVYGFNLKEYHYEPYGRAVGGLREASPSFFQGRYSGNGDSPLWIGAELQVIDECNDVTVTPLTFAPPSPTKQLEFEQAKAAAIEYLSDPDVAELLDTDQASVNALLDHLQNTQPSLFITWGSS